jgi:hypothetical protein
MKKLSRKCRLFFIHKTTGYHTDVCIMYKPIKMQFSWASRHHKNPTGLRSLTELLPNVVSHKSQSFAEHTPFFSARAPSVPSPLSAFVSPAHEDFPQVLPEGAHPPWLPEKPRSSWYLLVLFWDERGRARRDHRQSWRAPHASQGRGLVSRRGGAYWSWVRRDQG